MKIKTMKELSDKKEELRNLVPFEEDNSFREIVDYLLYYLISHPQSEDLGKNFDEFNYEEFKKKIKTDKSFKDEKIDKAIDILTINKELFNIALKDKIYRIGDYYRNFCFCLYNRITNKTLCLRNNKTELKEIKLKLINDEITKDDLSFNEDDVKKSRILFFTSSFDIYSNCEFSVSTPFELEEIALKVLNYAYHVNALSFNTLNENNFFANENQLQSLYKTKEEYKERNNLPKEVIALIESQINSIEREIEIYKEEKKHKELFEYICNSDQSDPFVRKKAVLFLMDFAPLYSREVDYVFIRNNLYDYGDDDKMNIL